MQRYNAVDRVGGRGEGGKGGGREGWKGNEVETEVEQRLQIGFSSWAMAFNHWLTLLRLLFLPSFLHFLLLFLLLLLLLVVPFGGHCECLFTLGAWQQTMRSQSGQCKSRKSASRVPKKSGRRSHRVQIEWMWMRVWMCMWMWGGSEYDSIISLSKLGAIRCSLSALINCPQPFLPLSLSLSRVYLLFLYPLPKLISTAVCPHLWEHSSWAECVLQLVKRQSGRGNKMGVCLNLNELKYSFTNIHESCTQHTQLNRMNKRMYSQAKLPEIFPFLCVCLCICVRACVCVFGEYLLQQSFKWHLHWKSIRKFSIDLRTLFFHLKGVAP